MNRNGDKYANPYIQQYIVYPLTSYRPPLRKQLVALPKVADVVVFWQLSLSQFENAMRKCWKQTQEIKNKTFETLTWQFGNIVHKYAVQIRSRDT